MHTFYYYFKKTNILLFFPRLDFLSSRIESKSILNDFIHSECQFDNSLIHDDRIEAFDAASQLIEGLKVHQEKEIEKKVTKTLNKLTTTSKNSGGKRNPRSKRETTVSQNTYIYIKKSTICCMNRLIDFGLGNKIIFPNSMET